jgi:gluconokinase
MDLPGAAAEVFRLGREVLSGRRDIELIALSSIWYHSGAVFNKELQPIGRLRTWADTSCSKTIDEFKKDPELYERIYEHTGNPPHSAYALYKWLQLCRDLEMPAKDAAAFMALPDYLFMRFTGKRMVSTMTASASGLLNIHSLCWDPWLMELAGISQEQLSRVTEPEHTEPLADEAAALLGLPAGLPVLVPGADGGCNQIAVGGLKDGVMSMSVGTSGALRLGGSGPLLSKGTAKNWCYYGAENRWINGAATNGAGSSVEWFIKDVLNETASLDFLGSRLLERYRGPIEAPIFLPFQFGERCPGWDAGRAGGWQDLTAGDDVISLYYSVLEGVLFNLYQCYLLLCQNGSKPERILVSGGIVRSPVWLKMAADIFGSPIELTDTEHASILGAVRIGQKVLGYLKSLRGVECEKARVVEPGARGAFSNRYERYLEWYERTK